LCKFCPDKPSTNGFTDFSFLFCVCARLKCSFATSDYVFHTRNWKNWYQCDVKIISHSHPFYTFSIHYSDFTIRRSTNIKFCACCKLGIDIAFSLFHVCCCCCLTLSTDSEKLYIWILSYFWIKIIYIVWQSNSCFGGGWRNCFDLYRIDKKLCNIQMQPRK